VKQFAKSKNRESHESRKIFKNVRLNVTEYSKIICYAKRCGLSISAYMRERALGAEPRGKDLSIAVAHLSKTAGLLKHLHNEGLGYSQETAEILRDIKLAINALVRNASEKYEQTDDQ
jgi:hypothetical protein